MNRTIGWVLLAGSIVAGCDGLVGSDDDVRSAHHGLVEAGSGYGAVVGEVNGVQISGAELGTREYFVRRNEPALESAEVREVAIRAIVEDRVMLEAAAGEGFLVNPQEVLAEVAQLRQLAAKDEGLRNAFRATADQFGIAEDEVFTDARVLAQYQRAFTLGRMKTRIVETLPAERRTDAAAVQGAMDRFVMAHNPRVRIFMGAD